ncbi:hypothetical protein MJO28_007610 [Puccinia striiformis f. sp. tritici]|uniref:Uncharacterized protein n=1 Tax=Puccinia striiformis f. sp. tritici TaxID=168172 RepID=A0ACC0EEW8_9BASI|nr:hypothetical protein MJO28_007610 [Puccinia striiformis f. sp. tritici]
MFVMVLQAMDLLKHSGQCFSVAASYNTPASTSNDYRRSSEFKHLERSSLCCTAPTHSKKPPDGQRKKDDVPKRTIISRRSIFSMASVPSLEMDDFDSN